MGLSLANKYRPTDFDTSLVGQSHIADILKYQAEHQTRQANYLFFGIRGIGKTSSARLFAKAINCLDINKGNPCNTCENCIAIQENATMDIVEIDAASHTGVDNIREEIIDKVGYRPSVLKKKVIIIDEVHMLSKGAFNALLKTMEEPEEWMIFILATTELHKIPETVLSRCQVFSFKKVNNKAMTQHLVRITTQEKISFQEQGLSMIARLSDVSMRDAVKYLDQISIMGEVSEETVSKFLGIVSDGSIADFLDRLQIFKKNRNPDNFHVLIENIEHIADQGVDLNHFPKQLMHYADREFLSDPDFFAYVSKLASELLSQSRRYPHPLVLYKTILWSFGNKKKINIAESEKQKAISKTIAKDESLKSKDEKPTTGSLPPTAAISQQFLEHLSPSLKRMLDDKCDLVDLTETTAILYVLNLNTMSKKILTNKKSQELMLSSLHKLGYDNVKNIDIQSISAEEYASKLIEKKN